MRNRVLVFLCVVVSCVPGLAGCKTLPESVFAFDRSPSFSRQLEKGYKMLAEYEEFLQEDEATAAYFKDKAETARRGGDVEPATVADKGLSPAEKDHFESARSLLLKGRQMKDDLTNVSALAEAQLNYDCWLMRTLKDQPAASYCQDVFYERIKKIHIADQAPRTFSVHFQSGKAIPSEDGLEVIKQAAYAHTMNENWPVYLVGFTDSVGDPDSNRILSMRRSMAVRNALAQFGVDMDVVEIEAVGEVDTTGSDAQSRRVDIKIEPAFGHKRQTTLAPEEILPHSFGN